MIHPHAVLVGHSLGAIAIVQLPTRWPQVQVPGALMLAPADPLRRARTRHFGPVPEQTLGVATIVAGSANDPWMDQGRARHLNKIWGADFVRMGEAGDINVTSGHARCRYRQKLWDVCSSQLGAVAA